MSNVGELHLFCLQAGALIVILEGMRKYVSLLLFTAVALMLESCTYITTHRRIADRGQQCQAVVIPDQENLVIFQHNGKLYLQGVLTQVRRSGRNILGKAAAREYTSGQYVPLKRAKNHYVYRELAESDIVRDDLFAISGNKPIPKGAKKVQPGIYRIDSVNLNPVTTALQRGWNAQLPKRARKAQLHMVSSEHRQVGTHLCNTRYGFIIPVTPARANKHAIYAYPAAGLALLLVDTPATLLSNTLVPVCYAVAAIPCGIYQKGKMLAAAPEKQ